MMTRKVVPTTGKKVRAYAALGAVVLAAASCAAGPTAPTSARVRVLLTDAPTDMLSSAQVWISGVSLHGGAAAGPDGVKLFSDPDRPREHDLLQLRDGVTADLTGSVDVGAGTYQELRLVVDSARVTLAPGLAFEDGSTTGVVRVPSGSASGIKVKLADVLRADEGQETEIVVDFEVDANFVVQTDPQSGAVRKVLFTPVLRETSRKTSRTGR